MPLVESLRYVVTADTAGAAGNLNKLGTAAQSSMSNLDKLKGSLAAGVGLGAGAGAVQGLVAGLTALGTVAVSQIGSAVNAASSLQQSAGASRAIFREAAGEIQSFGRSAADSVGLSNAAFQQQASVIGALLQNLGQTREESAATSTSLIQMGADLAATFGGKTSDAVAAIGSALRGERDPIERYGISLKQAAIDQEVLRQGLDTSTDALKTQAQSTAALTLIRQQAASSTGAFARESDTLAGAQQRFNAELEDARAEIGEAFLPVMTDLVQVARSVVGEIDTLGVAFGNMASDVKTVAGLLPYISTGLLGIGREGKNTGGLLGDAFRNALATVPGIGPTFVYLQQAMKDARAEIGLNEQATKRFDAALEATMKTIDGDALAIDRVTMFLPPDIREEVRAAAREMLALDSATKTTASSLKALNDAVAGLRSVGDTMFGLERQQTALSKAVEAGGDAAGSARSQAKAYESALRSIENAERSVADAQEALNETLIQRFLIGLGATSDEVTSAQINERESTRSLADAKLRLIDAEQALQRLRGGGAAASRLEAQAGFLDAQKALTEAQGSGDPSALLKAKAALIKAQQGLDDTSSAKQAQDLAKAQLAVESAQDNVTKAAIDQREAQRELNDTLIRGKEGSRELADANRQVEDAQRRLEDSSRALDDAQDGLIDALERTSAAGKTANERFDAGVTAAGSYINYLIDNKKTPVEFANAIDEIAQKLGGVAKEAGKVDELKAYLDQLERYALLVAAANGEAKVLGFAPPKGGFDNQGLPIGGGQAPRTQQYITLQVDGKTLAQVVVDQSVDQGGLPIIVKPR